MPRGAVRDLLIGHDVVTLGPQATDRREVPPTAREGAGDEAEYRAEQRAEDEPPERQRQAGYERVTRLNSPKTKPIKAPVNAPAPSPFKTERP